ncbi:MAG: sugar O-acetyltransferase [Synergistaceae bacterium]|nr:sugar O-acetyltransferase [Synergistaceae bacterium]
MDYNRLYDTDETGRNAILRELLPYCHMDGYTYLQGPIYFDYGINTYIGKGFYANFNFTVLDVCPVRIGDNVMAGTNVSLLTPMHPMRWQERNARHDDGGEGYILEYAKPITIGNNCWLAGSVTVTGGVTIGDGCVIGAGSVVTRDIPANSFAAGVPCRVIRTIDNNE